MLKRSTGLAAGLAVLVLVPSAFAAPVTVDLRVEGANGTLFEGPVTTDVRTFHFTGGVEHQCDGTAANAGTSPSPAPTRGAALVASGLAIAGDWSDQFGNPTINQVAGENVAYDAGTQRYLAEYKNGVSANVGSCGDPVGPGDDVLFAYARFEDRVLALSGPATGRPGQTATVKVTDAATGAPVSGASVGGRTTGADGTALIGPFSQRGEQDFKATKAAAIRSNRLRLCVSEGNDGFCNSSTTGGGGAGPAANDTVAPAMTLALKNGAVFSRRRAPRRLSGVVASDPSGLQAVKLKLTRRVRGKCSYFSGSRERFRPMRCGRRGSFFKIGDRAEWSYLLPKRLGRGRYVLEAKAIDGAFNRGAVTRVRFRVR